MSAASRDSNPVSAGQVRAVLATALPRTKGAILGVLFGILAALCTVALLATSAYLITRAAEQPPILYLSMAVVGVRAFALGRAFFRYLERLASHDAAFRQLESVRVDLLRRLIPLAPDGLGRTRRGSLLSSLVSDVDELQNLPLRVLQPLVTSLGVAAIAVWVVALISPAAAAGLALALVAAFVIGTVVSGRVAASAERSLAPRRAALVDAILDYLGSLDVLIAYGAEAEGRRKVEAADSALTRALTARSAGVGIAAAALSLCAGLAVAWSLVAGIPGLSAEDGLTGPALAVIVLVPLAVFEIVASVPLAASAWRQVRASAERIARLAPTDAPGELPSDVGTAEANPDPTAPVIALSNVTARWPGATAPTLSIDSLAIQRGERVLIEGPSGAGKTTLAHVLVRFLDYEGSYQLAGQQVRDLPFDAVRGVVGLCEQVPYLFDESIRQNLLFAKDTATDADLIDVLERVGLGEWLVARGGLDARVGERGALVSGGQAQRIALARALLRDFPVIVFDEPTANVEADLAESLLVDLLRAGQGDDRTIILISHADLPEGLVHRRFRIESGVLSSVL
ncbi:thiol reductant ABC exporter subunit CydC [Mycetocola zhujimingii]|uniref:thiol reductant ABC exporter subunit CydC n=1 Tax=Mycetocola zhujimingii TaxID=2079792 RepID=UPI000D331FE3|nr:thiol reductant ABC exporter subunit CydC [Mycetocola zhujimingii]AWB86623.1 thiol reductant ABC exporter subunit CydC [Mycetocola zhujimingii]